MAEVRFGHTATLLANGKVLVAGGYDGNVDLASAELYDPSTGTWSAAAAMATGRYRHTATLLANGKVLVAGGRYDSNANLSLASAELYNPDYVTTTTSLTATPNPVVYGRSVTFTATVAATVPSTAPTGAVIFKVDGTASATQNLNNGVATWTTTALTNGNHTIRAEYAGATVFIPSAAQLTQAVNAFDFAITNVVLNPVTPAPNGSFTATVTVKNQGVVLTGNGGTLSAWVNVPNAQACSAAGGLSQSVGNLAANASKDFTFTLTAGDVGSKTLRVFVDSTCAAQEISEANNQVAKSYRVTGDRMPDFVITALSLAPTSPTANGSFTLTATIKNQGSAVGYAGYLDGWSDKASVPTCEATDSDAWADIGQLAVGEVKTIVLTLPAGATAGTKTARAFIDSWCETNEASETNNQLTKSYTVNYNLAVTKAGTGTGTVTSAPAGINCGTACNFNFPNNQAVVLTATPTSGHVFAGWSEACTGTTTTCKVNMTANLRTTATFNRPYLLTVAKAGTGTGTVTSAPAGINCGGTCSANMSGTITLTAAPVTGTMFTGWGGACTGTATTCTILMSAAKNVTASFYLTYPVTVTKYGTGTVTSAPAGINCGATCSGNFVRNTSVTLTAAPATGKTFAGWAGDCTGTALTCTFSTTAAKNVIGIFN